MKSYSPFNSSIMGAKKLAWNGVLIATQIFLTLVGLPLGWPERAGGRVIRRPSLL